jgi:serine/threonine-protein kinase
MGFTHNHVPYIVFEYLEGTLLTDEIYRVGGLPVRRAVRVAQQIASALQAAHNASIVHRDLKSDNIFLTDKDDALDHVKVLDFGISRFLEADDEQTRRGMVMGTPEFMSPEQITAPDSVDRRADVYALGVILYEMLTARRPFSNDEDPRALLHRIVHNEPPPLQRPEVPHAMGEMILSKLLAKDPKDRFQSMLDVEAALDAFTTRGDGARGRRSRPMPVVSDAISRNSDTIPRPTASLDTPYPGVRLDELQLLAAQQVALPRGPRSTR